MYRTYVRILGSGGFSHSPSCGYPLTLFSSNEMDQTRALNDLPKLRVGVIGAARIARKNVMAIENSVSNCIVSAVGES